MTEQEENALKIKEILDAFNIGTKSVTPRKGPATTLYEVVPKLGVRISKIRGLKDEIAVGLEADGVRIIAPIPGKGTVGIEVPNKTRETLPIADMLSLPEFQSTSMELPCVLGRTVTNDLLMADLAAMPHLLIAGATGQGKSVCLNTLLVSLLHKRTPEELRLVLIDPKQVELSLYAALGSAYLAKPIITDSASALAALNATVSLMEDRYAQLAAKGARNILEYNSAIGVEKMPYLVVVIDEYGDLIMQSPKAMEHAICRLAQKARAVGIHLILSTQRPSVKIVTGDIKANFPVRIAFRTITSTDSRVVLGKKGAEALTGKGDMLFFDGTQTVRAQCAFTPTEYAKAVCEKLGGEYAGYKPKELFPEPPEPEKPKGVILSREYFTWLTDREYYRLEITEEERKYAVMATQYDYFDPKFIDAQEKGLYWKMHVQSIMSTLNDLGIIGDSNSPMWFRDPEKVNVHDPEEALRICDEYMRGYNKVHCFIS